MATTKKSRKRKDEYTGPNGADQEVEKASKDEYSVAKWIRKNVPTKKTKFLNHNVEYFTAVKALDALMLSKFAQGEKCLFPHRQSATDFLDDMLNHKFFHRAKKIPVSEEELKSKGKKSLEHKEKKEGSATTSTKEPPKSSGKEEEAESSHAEGKVDKPAEKEKRKRKIRLEMHPQQIFVDGHEAYVWIYDPIPMHYWIFGTLLVIGAIVICLFPLWPPSLRKGVYYLSIAAAGFLVFILGLAILRFVVFCIVWVFTGGKHHFWLLPNLTEDVGFVASFWPLYKHECKETAGAGKKSSKKRKRDKDSDAEDDKEDASNIPLLQKEKIENIKEHDADVEPETLLRQRAVTSTVGEQSAEGKTNEPSVSAFTKATLNDSNEVDRKDSLTPSESESESSQRSSTGKDFEILDADDVETS